MSGAARCLMVQGCSSHAGKSVVAAGLCRILRRRGLRVAPFKGQNMSLNSAATPDGLEIGRAQAVQAFACGVEPAADMNPILLKPSGEGRSQVVLRGRPWRDLAARDYYEHRDALLGTVGESLGRLRARFEAVVIEGAGSPAEPNLYARDVANMAVARLADAPVLLLADIERGGAFAAVAGTLALLPGEDRGRIRRWAFNKFRGDPALLGSGLPDAETRFGIPCAGVIPWIPGLRIDEEDSVGLDRRHPAEPGALRIAVVRHPRISNFTDFHPLEGEASVALRYAAGARDLDGADLVILPGTKTTIPDLAAARQAGIADEIVRFARAGGAVLGICGGFQMLGRTIRDPAGIESGTAEGLGLGLLPVETTLAPEKRTRPVRFSLLPAFPGGPAEGPFPAYEIHMGITSREAGAPAIARIAADGAPPEDDGARNEAGNVLGTYLHGLFDDPDARRRILSWAAACRPGGGAPPIAPPAFPAPSREAILDAELDRVADVLERSLDLGEFLAWLGVPRMDPP